MGGFIEDFLSFLWLFIDNLSTYPGTASKGSMILGSTEVIFWFAFWNYLFLFSFLVLSLSWRTFLGLGSWDCVWLKSSFFLELLLFFSNWASLVCFWIDERDARERALEDFVLGMNLKSCWDPEGSICCVGEMVLALSFSTVSE